MDLKNTLFGSADIQSQAANIGLAVLRIVAGLSLAFGHGIGKIPASQGFIEGVANLGFPMPAFFAWAAGISEFFGGLLLAAGLLTRPAAFFILMTMSTATFIRHADDPFGTKEKAILYGSIALAYLLVGAGRYAVDAMIKRSGQTDVV